MNISSQQIEIFIKQFYVKVNEDTLLSPIFNDVAKVDWLEHIPKLIKFWNSVLLKTGEYSGNAYQKHVVLASHADIQEIHFKRWLNLFEEQAKLHFDDDAAKNIIAKASNIASSLKLGVLKEYNLN
ncbi:group III truncated hemoglobin [Francisella sp. Scap27]|uniref:group III truncated hemoglobin n=1 Tax=Francisella sp. Scap27 TaxID=2589986 RepID=UPI0015BAF1DB|nr:group III truncated hemoglobin [Francisella sp. Scap27]QLE78905.1 group III truncated hemoglobin [Francisella sp. Scap27]